MCTQMHIAVYTQRPEKDIGCPVPKFLPYSLKGCFLRLLKHEATASCLCGYWGVGEIGLKRPCLYSSPAL